MNRIARLFQKKNLKLMGAALIVNIAAFWLIPSNNMFVMSTMALFNVSITWIVIKNIDDVNDEMIA